MSRPHALKGLRRADKCCHGSCLVSGVVQYGWAPTLLLRFESGKHVMLLHEHFVLSRDVSPICLSALKWNKYVQSLELFAPLICVYPPTGFKGLNQANMILTSFCHASGCFILPWCWLMPYLSPGIWAWMYMPTDWLLINTFGHSNELITFIESHTVSE